MKRRSRIALEVLGPPLLGAVVICLAMFGHAGWATLFEGTPLKWKWEYLTGLGVVVLGAYFIAGLPSLFYTAIMEWRFHRGLDPRSWRAVALSTFLGLLSGLAIIGVLTGFAGKPGEWAYVAGIGGAVGFLLGWLIKVRSERA